MGEQLSSSSARSALQQADLDAHLVAMAREQYRSLMKAHQETAGELTLAGLPMSEASDWLEYARMMVKWYLEKAYGAEVAVAAIAQEAEVLGAQLARQTQSTQLLISRMLQSAESSLRNRVQGQDLRAWSENAQTVANESLDAICRSAVARLRNAI